MRIRKPVESTFHVFLLILATVFLSATRDVEAQDCGHWSRIASPNATADATFLRGVSGLADDDVWSVGWYRIEYPSDYDVFPFALHWDGEQWNTVYVPEPPVGLDHKTSFHDVTAVSASEVWAVGNYIPPENVNTIETLAMKWDGDEWDVVPSPTAQIGSGSGFNAIDSKDGEIWAVGYSFGTAGRDNLAARWNGSSWEEYYPIRLNNGDHQFNSVHIHSANLVFAAGGVGPLSIPYVARWNGSSWSEVLPRINSSLYLGLTSIISFGPDDVWVGASRTENYQFQYFVYLHYDGSSWTEYPVVHPFHIPSFEGDDPDNFYSGGYGTLANFNGTTWELVDSLAVDVWAIDDITVLPSGTVFGSGNTYDTGSPETLTARFTPCHSLVDTVAPTELKISRGQLASGTLKNLAGSDNSDLTLRRTLADIQARTEFELSASSTVENPSSLEVSLEGSVFARSEVIQTIEMFDFSAGNWEQVDERVATRFSDSTVTVSLTGNLSRYVEAGTMTMRSRIRYESSVARQQFSSSTDEFVWSIGR